MNKKLFKKDKSAAGGTAPVSSLRYNDTLPGWSKWISGGFGGLFLLGFTWLFVSLCFFNNSTFEYTFWKQSLSVAVFASAMAVCYLLVLKLRRRHAVRMFMRDRFLLLFFIGMTVIFICQLIYVGLCTTSIGWDAGTLVQNAKAPDMGTTTGYFQQYPNNLFLLLFYRFFVLVFAFFKLPGVWAGLNVINVIAIDVAIILTVLLARRLFGLRSAYIAWFFCTAAIAFFPYIIVPYSDTMGMPFAIAILYCYVRICDGKAKKERAVFSILMGLCVCVGMLIKPTIVIPFLAVILIHYLFILPNKKKLLASTASLALVVITIAAANTCYQSFAKAHFPQDENMETPMTHFAMMGLHETKLPNGTSMYGAFYRPDVKATAARPTKEAKMEYNLTVIENRLKKMGLTNYLSYLNNKARWITSEGNFFWGGEGHFANFDYMTDCFIKELINSGSNELGFYMREDGKTQPGSYFDIYFYLSQAVWVVLLFFTAVPLFLKKRRGFAHRGVMILRCSIFGLMLFLLLFEGRSRYLINQLPYFILLASYGLNACIETTKQRRWTFHKKRQ